MFTVAKDMASRVWDQMSEQAASVRQQARSRMAEIEKQTAAFLDRIVEASSQTVIARYEQRITELERERLLMTEKLEAKARPRKSFGEMFELTLNALSSPCTQWKNGTLDTRRTLLNVTFEDRLIYCRNEGFRTPKTSMVYSMLSRFCGPKEGLAEGMSSKL